MNYTRNFLKRISEQTIILITAIIICTSGFFYISQINQNILQIPQNIIGWLFPAAHTTTEIQNLIIGGIQEMDTLTTAEVTNKTTVKLSRDRKLGRFNIGKTNLIYEGIGKVEAGIDFSQIEVTNVDDRQKSVTVVLPAPEISNVYLDIHQSSVVDTYKKWLGANIERELQDEAQRKALRNIKAEACTGNILEKSLAKAKAVVKNILTQVGFQDIQILVKPIESNGCTIN